MIAERIQALVHALDIGAARRLNYVALVVAVVSLMVWYDLHCYRNMSAPEAMDAAQVARHVAEGKGFSTDFIRPFSIYLVSKHNHAALAGQASGTNVVDYAKMYGNHPDLANAPLYPLVLAGMMKIHTPPWEVQTRELFWSEGGHYARYQPDFLITVFNQILLLAVVLLTFLITKTIFDIAAAWLAALLVLGSDLLWKFSISGLPVMLMLVFFLGIIWCLAKFEALDRGEETDTGKRFRLALTVGLLAGLGMMTRYSFGWVMVPVIVYFANFGGARRVGLAVASMLVFAAIITPWIVRNLAVSGTFFGTAGYAVIEGTMGFPGSKLMQSLNPDLTSAYWILPYLVKLQTNIRLILPGDLFRIASWMGILFFAGLLLGLRNTVARRLRHFTMMSLGVFLIVTALGRTQWSALSDINAENLLVLLLPMIVIFGVAFFLTLLNQMNVPTLQVRYAVVTLIVVLSCEPFILTLLPPKVSPSAYPPYYPPEIQKLSSWMQPDELMMSDIPWAVAWYGQRQCTWTTINSQYEFFQLYDYVKHVDALYLTLNTLDAKLFTECLQGGVDSWGNFALKTVAANAIPPQFPLKAAPYGTATGLFLTDHTRWDSQ